MTLAASNLRVVVNVISQTAGGGTTVARHLIRELAIARPKWALEVHVAASLAEVDWPATVSVVRHAGLSSSLKRLAWEQVVLPGILERGRADVYLALGGFACVLTRVPQVSAWQNALIWAPNTPGRGAASRLYIRIQRALLKLSLRVARVNVFPSRTAIEELSSVLGRRPPNAIVSYFGLPPAMPGGHPARCEAFALAVGDLYLHKNYKTLIDAFGIYRRELGGRMTLRIAGAPIDSRCRLELEDQIRSTDSSSFVSLLGQQSSAQVQSLYRTASLFVTSSLTESFGLTPLEAMAADLPVLAARASGTPEICADAAVYFDPASPRDLALQLRTLESDAEACVRLRAAGRLRAAEFSWRKTAEDYAVAIELAASGTGSPRSRDEQAQ